MERANTHRCRTSEPETVAQQLVGGIADNRPQSGAVAAAPNLTRLTLKMNNQSTPSTISPFR